MTPFLDVTGILLIVLFLCLIAYVSSYFFLYRSKPSKPKVAEYDGPEPVGYDLDQKYWDDPQWEQPPCSPNVPKFMLRYDNILTANEIRTLNLEKYISEYSQGQAILIPKGADLQVMRIPPFEPQYDRF